MKTEFDFTFGDSPPSRVFIRDELPALNDGAFDFLSVAANKPRILVVCDINTEKIARSILPALGAIIPDRDIPVLVLPDGESAKTWDSVEKILRAGKEAGLGRDGLFIGTGGGVIGDLTAFASSIYMRGAKLGLVSTTLLGMVDASLGGKTGIDLAGIKNLAGTFYPADLVFAPLDVLDSLPEREWKSGMAELIKTAVLDSDVFMDLVNKLIDTGKTKGRNTPAYRECLKECVSLAVSYKGRIVEADPRETGNERPLLNLGHTFAHALEGAAGLGVLSHGEAVAWGMVRSCELGAALGVTPPGRAKEITGIIKRYGYETGAPHPLVNSAEKLIDIMKADKKNIAGKNRFIVPGAKSAQIVSVEDSLVRKTIVGECLL